MLAVANCVPMRYMGSYKEEPMASTERTVKVRYIVVDTRKGIDLVVRHDLKDALQDCDGMSHAHVRREVEIAWENVKVTSVSIIHIATLDTPDGYLSLTTHNERYDALRWLYYERARK